MASASSAAIDVERVHDENRNRVCVICYRKGSRKLSSTDINAIQDYVIDGYSPENSNFPKAMCNGCFFILNKKRNGIDVNLPMCDNYDPDRPIILRSSIQCSCRICCVARADLNEAKNMKKKPGRRPSQQANINTESSFKVCGLCFAKLYRGCSHSNESCRSKRQKISNINDLLDSPTKVTKQRVASRIIDDVGPSLPTLNGKSKNLVKSPITPDRRLQLSVGDLSHIQNDLNLSDRQVVKLSKDIRYACESRTVIEPGLKGKITGATHQLDDLFTVEKLDFVTLARDEVVERCSKSAVICRDVDELVHRIVKHRNLNKDDLHIRVGIDGGGGFLKIGLSVFELVDSPTSCTRRKLTSGLSCQFKHSGVKRSFVLALVPDVQENYPNVKLLWIKTGLNNMHETFTIACDLKLCNLLVGIMPHGSKHPCSWCTAEKHNLQYTGTPRTIASLSSNFWQYFESGRDKQKARNFSNVIHPSIVSVSDSLTPIIQIIPPPELHLLSGPTATMYSGLEKEWNSAGLWLRKCHVERQLMHGGSFTGNNARTLLRNVDLLEDVCPKEPNVLRYVKAFRCFNEVVVSCYGSSLQPDFREKIRNFQNAYLQLPLNVTPKVHSIFFHIPEFCASVGRGLGHYSEQVIESLHHSFDDVWRKFKIHETHPQYGDRILRSVCVFNGRHF